METLESILAEHSFLKGLEHRYLKLLTQCASLVNFSPGQVIFTEGEKAKQFFLVRHGKVALEIHRARRGPITIKTIGKGDVLGWTWLVQPHHWHVDARAVELSRAVSLDVPCVLHLCETDHDFGYEIMKRFSHALVQKLKSLNLQLVDFYDD